MSDQPSQPVPKLRDQMPLTTKWIDAKRIEFGPKYVNDCIRRAQKGEPGLFYAMEAGHVLGTPWPPGHSLDQSQRFAIMTGCKYACFIAQPPDPAVHTSAQPPKDQHGAA